MARAAGESFIGRRMRLTPSKAASAPATAPAVGTRPISPTPLAPNGPSGSGSSTRMTSTSRHVLGAQDADLAQLERHRHAILAGKLLRQRVAEPHVHRALDLRLALLRVQGPADVVGGDHLLERALLVEDHDLGRKAESRMGLDLAALELALGRGVVDPRLAGVDRPDKL